MERPRFPNRESTQIVRIAENMGGMRIEGAHLLSLRIASQPEKHGDGYMVFEGKDGKGCTAIVIDISLGRGSEGNIADKAGKLITEARLLKDITRFITSSINGNVKNVNHPEILLNLLCERFNPSYMSLWRDSIDWGFSACAASFDPKSKAVRIANVGTNIVAQEAQPDSQVFYRVFRPNSRFFMPNPNKISITGGNVPITQAVIPNTGRVLLATDGVVVKEGFLKKPVVDLSGDPKRLLNLNGEGLYIVIGKP